MKNLHHRPEWRAFRVLIVEHDGGVCQICKRGPSDDVILQVHHKVYHKGRLPWDYDPSDCQTLCKLHHAEFHEKIRPSTGWDLVLEDDLEALTESARPAEPAFGMYFTLTTQGGTPWPWEPIVVID